MYEYLSSCIDEGGQNGNYGENGLIYAISSIVNNFT